MGGQYGQYYLYSNVFDDTTGIFAGATDATNLGTIALLGGLGGGLGGGYGQPSGYYPAPAYGAHPASAQGRKRRNTEDEDDMEVATNTRKRRECEDANDENCRKRRSTKAKCEAGTAGCNEDRKRRDVDPCEICRLNPDSVYCDQC